MRVVTLGALQHRPLPLTVSMGGLGQTSEIQARNTRAVAWAVGLFALVGVGGILLWKSAS